MFRRRDSIVDSITNCGTWRHRIATGIYKRAGSSLRVFVIPPPSSFPGEILHRFFRKEGRKERRRKKIHRERKQVVTITRATAHGSNPPREHNRENRDRTLEEFPVRDSIPLKISREIGILFAGIFLHRGSRPIISLFNANFFSFLSFFSSNSEIVPSPSRRKRKFSFARWRLLLLLLFGYIIGSNRCREREKGANFWNEKWSREKKQQQIKVCPKKN